MAELASHMRRVVDGDRHLIVQYWLIRLTMTGGQSSFAVLCTARQLRGGSLVSQESEIAGLGSNPAAARALYGQLVGGAALPIHLRDVVGDGRDAGEGAQPVPRLATVRSTPRRA